MPTPSPTPACAAVRLLHVVVACLLAATPAAYAGAVRFEVQRLAVGSLNQSQFLTGLNASGVVVGYESGRFTPATAFKIEDGALTLFAKPAGSSAVATGISDNGLIVGRAGDAGSQQAGYLGATFTPIAALAQEAGAFASAAAIDPLGRGVAGNLSIAHRPVAALHADGVTVSLGTLGGAASWVTGLNASGTVVGESELAVAGTAGFIFDGNGMRTTKAAAGYQSFVPSGINDAGQVVGKGVNSATTDSPQWAVGAGTPVDLNGSRRPGARRPVRRAEPAHAGHRPGLGHGRPVRRPPTAFRIGR